ncbi:MAG: outer membrane protein assembly factor BamA [Desulfobacteraceae bacterium]|nr:outer membrane protein assembly factor BamA [Desulfobacteraceae bacterium]
MLEVEGNEYFKESKIKSVMSTQTSALFRKGYFKKDIFNDDLEAVKNLYFYEGFLHAEVSHELIFDSTNKRVDILLSIIEGKQILVKNINFEGNKLFDAEFLKQELVMKPEQSFDHRKIDVDNQTIENLYDDRGYADISVNSEYNVENNEAYIYHKIIEGEKQYVDQIEISGLKRTREDVITRELRVEQNDVFRYARLLESQRNLYKLGIFRSIRIQMETSKKSNHKNIRFVLTEKKAMILNFRVGYGTQDYLRIGAGFTHRNVFGRAWQGKIEGKLSFIEQSINTQMTFPRSFLFPEKLNIGLYYKLRQEIGYRTQTKGGYIKTNFEFDNSRMSAKYEADFIRTDYEPDDSMTTDLIHSITVGWLRDNRDNPFYTTRGNYINMNIETSGILLPSDVDYVKPTLQFRFFKPLGSFVLASALRMGIVKEIAPTLEIPIYKRFFCGGASSVRGYAERDIGPVDENGNPIGGGVLCEVSAEQRFPIYKILGGIIFIDGGNIWQEYTEISSHLRWGAGAGLRLKTPLGSVRLDYGIKINRQSEETIGALHFAIGEAF